MAECRRRLDFGSYMDCASLAASTDEILWSDDETIIAEQEVLWKEGKNTKELLNRFRKNFNLHAFLLSISSEMITFPFLYKVKWEE